MTILASHTGLPDPPVACPKQLDPYVTLADKQGRTQNLYHTQIFNSRWSTVIKSRKKVLAYD
jgi:hypothetical protein